MPRGLINQEWLNANSQRAYPLTEAATKLDVTESFRIPDGLILGLYFPVSAGLAVDPTAFFIRRIAIFGPGINIALAYDDGNDAPPIVASAVIASATHEEYGSYALPGRDDFDDSVGRIVIGDLSVLDGLPAGQYYFDYGAGKLEVDCIRPMIDYVSSVVVVSGADRSARLVGDITLTAGNNMQFTVSQADTATPSVRIDAIDGAGLTEECVCTTETEAPCIRTINGVVPVNGNIDLLGDTCIEVAAIAGGVTLSDVCSQSCCDCVELEAITNELEQFGEAATTVRGFVNRLQAEVTQMSMVVLGSRLSDEGCSAEE